MEARQEAQEVDDRNDGDDDQRDVGERLWNGKRSNGPNREAEHEAKNQDCQEQRNHGGGSL